VLDINAALTVAVAPTRSPPAWILRKTSPDPAGPPSVAPSPSTGTVPAELWHSGRRGVALTAGSGAVLVALAGWLLVRRRRRRAAPPD
jgi:hypothetical protein